MHNTQMVSSFCYSESQTAVFPITCYNQQTAVPHPHRSSNQPAAPSRS
ncbi:MAG: hypothetical protein M5U34_35975 [Chloroflexi bacterium]|nr:hypothetical protein [Chloroflexota bacterium]